MLALRPAPATQAGETKQTIAPTDVGAAALNGTLSNTFKGPAYIEWEYLLHTLTRYYQDNPNTPPAEAVDLSRQWQKAYERKNFSGQTSADYDLAKGLDIALSTLSAIPEAGPLVQAFKSGYQDTADILDNHGMGGYNAELQDTAIKNQAMQYEAISPFIAQYSADTIQEAKDNPVFAQAVDAILAPQINHNIEDFTNPKLLQTDQDIPTEIRVMVKSDGSLTASIDDLKNSVQGQLNGIEDDIKSTNDDIKSLDEKADYLINWTDTVDEREAKIVNDALDAREQKAAAAQAQAQKEQLQLEAARSSVYILSTIISVGFNDPKLGQQVGVIGNSAVQIAEAMEKFSKIADSLTGLGAVVLTGNVLAAVMNIASLFIDTGPTPDDLILQGIDQLRQQLTDLQTEMNQRFDRIDQSLSTIYSSMMDQFAALSTQIRQNTINTDTIEQALFSVQAQLNRVAASQYSFLQTANRESLLQATDGGLGYRFRNGSDMSAQQFNDYASVFHSWAVVNSLNDLEEPLSNRSVEDADIADELTNYPLMSNLSYLNQVIQANASLKPPSEGPLANCGDCAWRPFAGGPLPNPQDWQTAAAAYAQLELEEPRYATPGFHTWASNIETIGQGLDQALASIAVVSGASGPQPNYALFHQLEAYYKDKLVRLDNSLQSAEQDYRATVLQNYARKASVAADPGIDLWGGPDQRFKQAYTPVDLRDGTVSCGEAKGQSFPAGLASDIPALFLVEDYLNLGGKFQVCGSSHQIETNKGECDNPKEDHCTPKYATIQHMEVQYNGQVIADQNYRNGAATGPDALVSDTTALESTVRGQVEKILQKMQTDTYKYVLSQIDHGTVVEAIRELYGAKLLLQDFALLAMPEAFDSDDLLRSLFFGSDALVGGKSDVEYPYAANLTPADGGNIRSQLTADGGVNGARLTVLEKTLDAHLAEIAGGPPTPSVLATTALRVQVADAAAAFGAGPQSSSCQFVLGFKAIHDLIPEKVGSCRDDEGHNPANGDALQHTTGVNNAGGLLVWRKADNWTAFTDGYRTWVNGPNGLQQRLNTQRFPWEANPDRLPIAR